ncbi:BsuBI/PstI family type II restriction endonuclease [Candidatus Parabeggiatoa sp. HSG14]|uniref:BsuBI/PstI family type II restriction endonuclease n=1 Tax=Candidatus Parabeggiatoa sp. HSG14 TaxID=3055593 RepID=UPI0025A846CE|nr:BsuBI/PstI family type II restriction endonuclease [Thiotrichales bacterium HSG14]
MSLKNNDKSASVKKIIEESIEILDATEIPIFEQTERRRERMAMAFLAVAGVTNSWKKAQGLEEKRTLKTRDIITFINEHFEENISSGSYDDIRRKDLRLLVLAGFIINSAEKKNAATNDPTRGYSLEAEFKNLIVCYKTNRWKTKLQKYIANKVSLKTQLARKRNIEKVPVTLPNGQLLELSAGQHNVLQKQIIEEFLPRFGKGCQILYLGDTSNKMLFIEGKILATLNFSRGPHDELPDIITYNAAKNWLYLIEAVHSSGTINEVRLLELKELTKNCPADVIYVTTFLNKKEFKKWIVEIAWETEVWIADNPDHLIHFDGHKFLGPY